MYPLTMIKGKVQRKLDIQLTIAELSPVIQTQQQPHRLPSTSALSHQHAIPYDSNFPSY